MKGKLHGAASKLTSLIFLSISSESIHLFQKNLSSICMQEKMGFERGGRGEGQGSLSPIMAAPALRKLQSFSEGIE